MNPAERAWFTAIIEGEGTFAGPDDRVVLSG
jgi:hypothetical protein